MTYHAPMSEKFLNEGERMLREAGVLVTKQRVGLISMLRKARRPLQAEKIASTLEGKMNLTTVYRSLDQLVEAGLVRRIDLGRNHALYELADSHHHHIVCRTCGLIEDVTACIPTSVTDSVLKKVNTFSSIENHALEFFGVCKPCAKKKHK